MDCVPDDVDDAGACEAAPPGESDSTAGYRFRQADGDQPSAVVFRREGAGRHHGDAQTRGNYLSDRLLRITLPAFGVRATEFRARVYDLLLKTVARMWQEYLFRAQLGENRSVSISARDVWLEPAL